MKNIWNWVSNLGLGKLNDPEETRNVRLVNRIVFIGSVNLVCLVPVGLYFDEPVIVLSILIGIVPGVLSLVLSHKGHFNASRTVFLLSAYFYIGGLSILNGKEAGSQVSFILLSTLHLVFFRKSKWSLAVFGCILLLFAGVCWWIENHASYFSYLSPEIKRAGFYLNIVSNMVLVYCVVLHFKKAATEYETVILRKNEEITEKNKSITDSIVYARRIQHSLLPTHSYIEKTLERLQKERGKLKAN
jgi:hypothetical protein